MRSLSAPQLVEVWERGTNQHPVDRALTLLSVCCEESKAELAELSIGRRDARLLEVYERTFGPDLEAFTQCPQCGEQFEYRLSTRELALPLPETEQQLVVKTGETCLRLRLLNSLDLRAASESPGVDRAFRLLLDRCVLERDDRPGMSLEDLPESTLEQIASCLAQADPLAEIVIDLTCSACSHTWQLLLDIEGFLWAKVSAIARRLLQQVHALASAYGWSESDIMALSSVRRHAYLEMVGA
ncbi:MAG TPA: phage baseplate protein [Candidatus Angelobacter sp.]|nr:phage baseplate protein [Candidatus Angelobacter sp.]